MDIIFLPSGIFMTSGFVAASILETGFSGKTKFPVAPVSAMAWYNTMFILDTFRIVLSWGIVHCFYLMQLFGALWMLQME